jgi:hypothetical protein
MSLPIGRSEIFKLKRSVWTNSAHAIWILMIMCMISAWIPASDVRADTRSTVIMNETSSMTSLNPFLPDTDLQTNHDAYYLTHSGFNYLGANNVLIRNNQFGSYSITRDDSSGFQVTYSVRPGQYWSDGVPITASDLMFNLVIGSSDFSKSAGLGDPSKGDQQALSIRYGGALDSHLRSNSYVLSDDKMTLIINYSSFFPEWESASPVPFPAHALVMMAGAKEFNGDPADAALANAALDSAITSVSGACTLKLSGGFVNSYSLLAKIANVWNTSYNITTFDSSNLDPLLLVSNGGFKIASAVDGQSVIFIRNDRYNSGPALANIAPIKSIVFKFLPEGVADRALANGDIDLYSGIPTMSSYAYLRSLQSVTRAFSPLNSFEHVDLRVGSANSMTQSESNAGGLSYQGIFAGNSQRARNLREAFLLAMPRQQIATSELIKAFDPDSTELGQVLKSSVGAFTASSWFDQGTQESRDQWALSIVQQYFPNATAQNPTVPIRMLFGAQARRIDEANLIAAEEAKAGFLVSNIPDAAWSSHLNYNSYDAALFAWSKESPLAQDNLSNFSDFYSSSGKNNHMGWTNLGLDDYLASLKLDRQLKGPMPSTNEIDNRLEVTYDSMPLYQLNQVIAYDSALSGVLPIYQGGSVVSNYFYWTYGTANQPGYPLIYGTGSLSETLTTDPGTWPSGVDLVYQWFRDGQTIPGENLPSYLVSASDQCHSLSLSVTGNLGTGAVSTVSNSIQVFCGSDSNSTYPPSSGTSSVTQVTLTGNPVVGGTLAPNFGNLQQSVANMSITWLRNGLPSPQENASASYRSLALGDLGATFQIQVAYTAADGTKATQASPIVTVASTIQNSPCSTSALDANGWSSQQAQIPLVVGIPKFGNSLIGVNGSWPLGTKICSFWYENGKAISGATSSKYKIQGADVGQSIQYCVVGSDKKGNALLRYSDPITATNQTIDTLPTPSITGNAVVGGKLTVKYKTFGTGFSYYPQWYRNGEPIPDATSSTYIPTPDDLSKVLSVVVSGNKQYFDPAKVSTQTLPVLPAVISHQPTVKFIGNKTSVGSSWTGVAGNWPAHVNLAVQWLRDGQPVSGETKVTYTISSADHGHIVSFQVTASSPGYLDAIKVSTGKLIP